jgi:hypothetical protein
MSSDASCVGQNAVVMEYQKGSSMCNSIQLTGISMFIITSIVINIPWSQSAAASTSASLPCLPAQS